MDTRYRRAVNELGSWALIAAVAGFVGWSCWREPDDGPKGLQIGKDGAVHWVPMSEEDAAKPWDGKLAPAPRKP